MSTANKTKFNVRTKIKWRDLPIQIKFIFVVLFGLGLAIVLATILVSSAIRQFESRVLERQLSEESQLAAIHFAQHEKLLQDRAASIVGDEVLATALAIDDKATLNNLAATFRVQHDLDYLTAVNAELAPMIAQDSNPDVHLNKLLAKALSGTGHTDLLITEEGWLLTTVAPVTDPVGNIGAVAIGRIIDNEILQELNLGRISPVVHLHGPDGEIVASSGIQEQGETVEAEHLQTVHKDSRDLNLWLWALAGNVEQTVEIENGIPHRVIYAPLRVGNRIVGVYSVEISPVEIRALQQQLITRTLAVLIGAGLLVAAIIYLLMRQLITNPLVALGAAAKDIGAGNLDAPLPLASNDEIGQLTTSFGVMVNRLRHLFSTLEDRVAERTAQLTKANEHLLQEIVEREQTQEELKSSEEKFSNLFQHSSDAIFLHDLDANIIDVNQKALDLFGYTRAEILSLKMGAFYPTDILKGDGPIHRRTMTDGFSNYEIIFKKKNQSTFSAEVSSTIFKIEDIPVIQSIVRDITERRQAEQALRQQHDFLQQVIDINPHLIFAKDRKGRFTLANLAFAKAYHTTVPALIGKTDQDFNPNKEMIEQYNRDDMTVIETGEELFIPEERVINVVGQRLWRHTIKRPIKDENGAVRQVLGVVTDITDRKRAEDELRESETRFRRLVEQAADAFFVINDKGKVIDVNQQACDSLRYSRDELLNLPISAIDLTLNSEQISEILIELVPGMSTTLLGTHQRRDNTVFPVETRVGLLESSGETLLVALARDITERKQAEEAIIEARDRALEASRLKTQLLAKVSHELRTPLGAILGYSEMLEYGIYGSLSDDQLTTTSEIIKSTKFLTGLVNELLDQAQLEVGKVKLNISSFAPVRITEYVQSTMSVLAEAKNLNLSTHIDADVPITLSGDLDRLQQMLVNLVGNAIKFTDQGSVDVRIFCTDPCHWALQVSDTGPGIPHDAQSYIFEPFQQVDGSATRQHRGSGLGLSIIKQLTALMDGEVSLKSELGQGSTFTVILPLQPILEETT